MIQLIPQLRILLACQPIDFRNGIDGLASVCKRALEEDPFSGALFVFRNRRGTALKLLCYDGVGFWLVTRRLSEVRIRWWPGASDTPLQALEAQQLSGRVRGWHYCHPLPSEPCLRLSPHTAQVFQTPSSEDAVEQLITSRLSVCACNCW